MDQTLPPRLPAHLESAVQRVRMAARSAAERTVDSLGLAALASTGVVQRDALLGAQYELNRKLAIFALSFNEALETDVARQSGALVPTAGPAPTPDALVASWESLSLVDDHELEIHISADRFALEIGHACEWEIRELDAYMGSLLGLVAAEHDRNPLRAEVIGQAMIRAIEAVSDRPEVRKVLSTEIGRSLATAMRQTYADICSDLRNAGVRPMGLAVRPSAPREASVHGGLHDGSNGGAPTRPAPLTGGQGQASRHGVPSSLGGVGGPDVRSALSADGRLTTRAGAPSGFSGLGRGTASGPLTASGYGTGGGLGQVDGEMMSLIRRLAQAPALHGHGGWAASDFGAAPADHAGGGWGHSAEGLPLAAPNLIVAYRDELRRHASGALDGMVIDVIASLFDQILSDGKVPPQMARQIARLQLPVLRAALGDNSFFSSRRHPVRRFVNRIASLGTAVDDFDGEEGRALLARVAALVQEVVDGDFEQIEVYEQKLRALEDFVTAQARAQVQALGPADRVLAAKEEQLRVQQRYGQTLEDALRTVPVPDYLRDFLAATWSRVIASAALEDGEHGALAQRLRMAGRELVMSVQPKGTPALRQAFLRSLPQLMKDLNLGLDRIAWPDESRRDFFARLLPAHAESLKGQALSTLDHNLLVKQVDGALATPLPSAADLPPPSSAGAQAALQALATPAAFTPAEARAVGLVDEQAVDWSGSVDIDLGAEPEITAGDIDIAGLPAPEPVEPTRGKSLADHVQIGFAYQLQLQGEWQKVRLAHVSPGRSFFVFTHGAKQRETVSMTYRMLARLCEAGRFRAMENAYLLERATARARRQLAGLVPARGAAAAGVARSAPAIPAALPARHVPAPAAAPATARATPPEPPARRTLASLFGRRG